MKKRRSKRKEDNRKREKEPSTHWSTKIHCYSHKLKVHIKFYILKVYVYFYSTKHWIIYVNSSAALLTQTQPILEFLEFTESQGGIVLIKTPSRMPEALKPFLDIFCWGCNTNSGTYLHFLLLLAHYLKIIYPCRERIHYKSCQN